MDGKSNTPRVVCGVIVAVAVAAIAVAAVIGCSSLGGGSRKADIATAIQTAYDLGGRAAVSNKIESLVAEGKVTPAQAARLHALAQLAYEGIVEDLSASGADATPTCDGGDGCSDCADTDAGDCAGGSCASGADGEAK